MAGSRSQALLCEDLPGLRRALGIILHDTGFDVIAAVGSASDAVAKVRAMQPDVVVVDIALSGDLGLGIIAALTDAARGCSVVVMSALDGLHDRAIAAGAADLVGTADPRPLRRALQAMLAGIHGCTCGAPAGVYSQLSVHGASSRMSLGNDRRYGQRSSSATTTAGSLSSKPERP